MFTIKELCEKSRLSRSTILYYDSIGLLRPVERSESNYRLYSEDSLRKLDRICTFREAGVPLTEISKILNTDNNIERDILEKTLQMLNSEAKKIKSRQEKIIKMLEGGEDIMAAAKGIDKDLIIESLRLVGVNDDGLDKLHANLEKSSPESHQSFLEFLGFTEEEIKYIRTNAQKDNETKA